MVGTADKPPPLVEAGGQGPLLATKLYLPRPPPGFVARPRLTDQLDRSLDCELTLVCAPPGWGKTSLLADWSRRHQEQVAFVCVDVGDNDPARFWRHVAAAIDRVRPGIAQRLAPLLSTAGLVSYDGFAAAVVNELAAGAGEVVLMLDDYHQIDNPLIHQSLLLLIESAPHEFHVLLAGRADPPLPLARRRANGRLVEVRAGDLRFTKSEAATLLHRAVGAELRNDAITALVTSTEGWAAGLQLAGLSLPEQPDVDEFIANFSGSHRYVLDYLTEEVLEELPEPVRTFLSETSVLEKLCGPLCDSVTGRTDSQQLLEKIERANLFLIPLDDNRGWWRYHHLFADLLRARLRQHQPERERELHRKAATWHEQHGPVEAAIHHTLAAGDPIWSARLIERHFDSLFLGSQGATVRRWIAALPAHVVQSRPRLLLTQARMALLRGDAEEVNHLLEAAERASSQFPEEPYEPSVGRAAASLANIPAAISAFRSFVALLRGDADQTIAFGSRALAELGDDEWMLESLSRVHLAMAAWMQGRLGEAEREIASTIKQWLRLDVRDQVLVWYAYLARIRSAQGHLDLAAETYQRALDVAAAAGQSPPPAAGAAYVGLADLAYQRDDLEGALDHITTAIPLCRMLAFTLPLAAGLARHSAIKQATGDEEGARATIAEAANLVPEAVVDVFNPAPVQRARLLLDHGDLGAAARWTAERGLSPDDEPEYQREPAHLVLARVLLGQGRVDQALGLLDRLRASAVEQQRISSVIEIDVLRSLALAAKPDEAAALTALTSALTRAYPQRLVRVFADEGPPMAALVMRLLTARRIRHSIPPSYLLTLSRALKLDGTSPPSGPWLAIPLSERELDVLRLLAAGKGNQEIARELFVTLNTVKKHVTHILDKLGATNRTAATTRARELGLLD